MKANQEIRETLAMCNIKHWELADQLGITPSWLCVKLRKELSDSEKITFMCAIDQIEKGRTEE